MKTTVHWLFSSFFMRFLAITTVIILIALNANVTNAHINSTSYLTAENPELRHTKKPSALICGTDLTEEDPALRQIAEERIYNWTVARNKSTKSARTESDEPVIYRIPTVVHVVHATSTPLGQEENKTDQEITEIINGVNKRFKHASGKTFDNPYSGTDLQIELCLASRDPDGKPTTGIVRHPDDELCYNNRDIKTTQETYHWPTADYYNIYLVRVICDNNTCPETNNVAGYSMKPSSHGTAIDGSVYSWDAFWDGLIAHESGHYFSLDHNFQGGCVNNNCLQDGDRVCDTPPKDEAGLGESRECYPSEDEDSCKTDEDDTDPRNPFRSVALGGAGNQSDGYENYMDYTGPCWEAFTQGQKVRMRAAIATIRSSLLKSAGCIPFTPNDAGITEVIYPENIACGSFSPIVKLKNYGTENLTSADIIVKTDGTEVLTYSWTGNLAPGTATDVTLSSLSPSPGKHNLYAYTSMPNKMADGYEPNNGTSTEFEYNTPITSFPYSKNMENNALPSGWTVADPDDTVSFDISSTNCAGNNGNYAIRYHSYDKSIGESGTSDILLSSVTDLTDSTYAELKFDLAYKRTYTNRTTVLDVSVSADCGVNYTSLYNKTESDLNTQIPFTWDPDVDWIPGSCNDWRTETVSLNNYIGNKILIKYEITVPEYWGQNLYLDNISIDSDGNVQGIKADINGDGNVNVHDAVLGIQVCAGMVKNDIHINADVNGDGKIGMEEVIYILQIIADTR